LLTSVIIANSAITMYAVPAILLYCYCIPRMFCTILITFDSVYRQHTDEVNMLVICWLRYWLKAVLLGVLYESAWLRFSFCNLFVFRGRWTWSQQLHIFFIVVFAARTVMINKLSGKMSQMQHFRYLCSLFIFLLVVCHQDSTDWTAIILFGH